MVVVVQYQSWNDNPQPCSICLRRHLPHHNGFRSLANLRDLWSYLRCISYILAFSCIPLLILAFSLYFFRFLVYHLHVHIRAGQKILCLIFQTLTWSLGQIIIIIIIYLPLSKAHYRLSFRIQMVMDYMIFLCNHIEGISSQINSLSLSLKMSLNVVFLMWAGRKFHNFGPM